MSMIEKLMIAITHGVGPRNGDPPSSRRSAGEANSQPNIRRCPRARRIAERPGRVDQRPVLEPDQLRARALR